MTAPPEPSGYIEYQRQIRTAYAARGVRISNRTVKRLAREQMSAAALRNAPLPPRHRPRACEVDPTGQQAVKNVMKQNSGPEVRPAKNRLEAA